MNHYSHLILTHHARRRVCQRAIDQTAIEMAIEHGERIEQNGMRLYFLGRRHLPDDVPPAEINRLSGLVAVMSRDGHVVTAYKVGRLPRHLRQRRFRGTAAHRRERRHGR